MRAINGRVTRLERASEAWRIPEDEGEQWLRRFEELLPLVPKDALRLYVRKRREQDAGAPPDPELRAVCEKMASLVRTGAWPA